MKNQEGGRNQVKKLDEIKLNDELSPEALRCDCCNESSTVKPKMKQNIQVCYQ